MNPSPSLHAPSTDALVGPAASEMAHLFDHLENLTRRLENTAHRAQLSLEAHYGPEPPVAVGQDVEQGPGRKGALDDLVRRMSSLVDTLDVQSERFQQLLG